MQRASTADGLAIKKNTETHRSGSQSESIRADFPNGRKRCEKVTQTNSEKITWTSYGERRATKRLAPKSSDLGRLWSVVRQVQRWSV